MQRLRAEAKTGEGAKEKTKAEKMGDNEERKQGAIISSSSGRGSSNSHGYWPRAWQITDTLLLNLGTREKTIILKCIFFIINPLCF